MVSNFPILLIVQPASLISQSLLYGRTVIHSDWPDSKKYDIFYFEEPTTPTPQLSKYVHDNTGLAIANGERIYTRWQYADYFKENAIQVIQPDIGTCGGPAD